jgi:hypothetical protein
MNFIRKILIRILSGEDWLSKNGYFYKVFACAIYDALDDKSSELKKYVDFEVKSLIKKAIREYRDKELLTIDSQCKDFIREYIKSESFIDSVVEKINKKQLK